MTTRTKFFAWAVAAAFFLLLCNPPGPSLPVDDYWTAWRSRQRADLATLPKPPAPPSGPGQPIDRFLAVSPEKRPPLLPSLIDDGAFARRVYLDVVGLLPSVEQLERFQRDVSPHKRADLVDRLLADDDAYAEHWMTFWNDLLRNDEQTNIDGLRKPITPWLYVSLRANKPLDLFVAELLNPRNAVSDGYLKGVNWRGRVNASQAPEVQAAQNVSQVFLASSLKCASCHDSFINSWKLKQAYGLAAFFTSQNPEMHRCDKGTGEVIAPEFLFPGLGSLEPGADLEARHRAVARMVTRPKNPRFAKTMVNRLWKRLLGRGLFEPVDDFDSQSPNSALLEWLAYDFMGHDYDAKHTLRQILLSRVYQSPVAEDNLPRKGEEPPPLLGPTERRLTSEQYLDAIAQVTGYWPSPQVMKVVVSNPNIRAWRYKKPDSLALALGRPNREQVCTERNQESTVLQALELINGDALAGRLREGAKRLLKSDLGRDADAAQVVNTLYLRSLGRPASAQEVASVRKLLGQPGDSRESRQQGWEDFLWMLFMNPQFQFIR
jgi:Protein of unknown function (DUF1553)/Protein of unknown function (DUF1549)